MRSRFEELKEAVKSVVITINCMNRITCIAFFYSMSIALGDTGRTGIPPGNIVPPSSISPNREYGVSVFDDTENPIPEGDIDDNKVINLRTGHAIGVIHAWSAMMNMNRGGILPARWSDDSSLLLWEVEGRWSPWALVLLKVKEQKIEWQIDLLKTVQQAIVSRTRRAAPRRYAAAKKWNKGSGEAFPDGFNVNVRAEGDKERGGPKEDVRGKSISLPFKVHAELTSNPKELDTANDVQLDSQLDGIVRGRGIFTVTRFRVRTKPFHNATETSWSALTNAGDAQESPEYGDVITLEGTVTKKQDKTGNPIYILSLTHKNSIPAFGDDPAEPNVSEVRLYEFDRFPDVSTSGTFEITGTIGHDRTNDGLPSVTMKVHGYESRNF
jgi:hypothetical protein